MNTIDISYIIKDNMPIYPGDKNVFLKQINWLANDSFNAFYLQTGMHVGTHIDIPMHLTKDERTINSIPVDRFIGNGILLDVRGEKVIKYKPEYDNLIFENDVVLICTDFATLYEEPYKYYNDYPIIDPTLSDFFIHRKIKILGIDTPSPDRIPFYVHKKLLENDIYILENLTNLKSLLNIHKFEVFAIPLKIEAEASLVRAFAKIY